MQRFINDDAVLKKGGRSAVKITDSELKELIMKKAKAVAEDYDDEDDEMDMLQAVSNILWYDDNIKKDLKITVDFENVGISQDTITVGDDALIGFQTL